MEIVIHYWNVCVIWTLYIWSSKTPFFVHVHEVKKIILYTCHLQMRNSSLQSSMIFILTWKKKSPICNCQINSLVWKLRYFFGSSIFTTHKRGLLEKSIADFKVGHIFLMPAFFSGNYHQYLIFRFTLTFCPHYNLLKSLLHAPKMKQTDWIINRSKKKYRRCPIYHYSAF